MKSNLLVNVSPHTQAKANCYGQFQLFPTNLSFLPARLPDARMRNWQEHSAMLASRSEVCGGYPALYWALPSPGTTPNKV